MVELLSLAEQGKVSGPTAKSVLEEMFESGKGAGEIVADKGLTQISDASALEATLEEVIAANPQAVEDFKGGKEQSLKFLVGQVMRLTKGRADPKLVGKMLSEKLEKDK